MSTVPDSHAAWRQSRSVFQPGAIVAFVAVVLLAIAALLWHYRVFDGTGSSTADARLQSAQMLLRSGQFAAAQAQLHPLLAAPQGQAYRQALLTQWQILWTRALSYPAHTPQRRQAEHGLHQTLANLLQRGGWDNATYRRLAENAQALGAYDLSAQAWLAVARQDPRAGDAALKAAAAAYAAGGRSGEAGQIYMHLVVQARTSSDRRRLFLQALAFLEGAGSASGALRVAQPVYARYADLRQDPGVTVAMAHLALGAGRPALAAEWLQTELLRADTGVHR